MARTYNPKKVSVIVGSHEVEGFAEGSMVDIAFNADKNTLSIGVKGTGSRAMVPNKSARITITLAQTSPSNAVLQALSLADETADTGVPVPVMVKDGSGESLYATESAWVVKDPDATFNDGISDRVWVFETDVLVAFTGGNDNG